MEHAGNVCWDFTPGSQEGFLEEGTSKLRPEGNVRVSRWREDEVSGQGGNFFHLYLRCSQMRQLHAIAAKSKIKVKFSASHTHMLGMDILLPQL